MLVTKNRVGMLLLSLLAMVMMLAACAPPGPRALLKGKDLLDSGKTIAAIEELRIATDLMPTNAAAWNYLGVAYHRSGQWTNATEAYSQALRFNRNLLEVRFNLGCLWLEQNNFEAAKADLFAYTSRRPNDGVGWLKLGTAQMRLRELGPAENSFREALRVDARDVAAMNGLGLIFAQRNRPREAADSFAAAVNLQPNYRPALLNLATVLQQQLNDRAGALRRYREYLQLQPRDDDWEAVNAIVRSLEPASVAPVRPVASNNSVPASAVTNIARPIGVTNTRTVVSTNVSKPLIAATPVVRINSNPPPPTAEVVKLAPEPVIKTTPDDKSSVIRPTVVPTVNATTAVTKSTNAPAAEKKSFLSKLNPFKRETKATAPPVAVAGSNSLMSVATASNAVAVPAAGDRQAATRELARGQEAQRARRLSEAVQYYRRATALDGSYFEAHYALGLASFEAKDFKLAATAWENALAIRPDSGDARYNFALTFKAAGQPQDAAAQLEKLLALHPDEARGHLTLGNLYAEQLRDTARARKHYQQVLQLDPQNSQAQAIRYWLVANPG